MSSRRQPSIPPRIPGFEFVRLLGMGGFADVFEYRQELPRRSVAVKVLLSGSLDEDAREAFFAEANVMAQLSHHPSIVTVYHADIAADGRPYLVMEYCSRPGLGTRYRLERFTVAEVLRTGIRVASAVEAAHHLGILHRDIKPANILATDFGWPALTDFGIASTLGSSAAATGMSIPWSAPELLAEVPRGDARGDVYSLAATIYSLLVGRSPFEVPGRSNSPADLLARIQRAQLPPIDREDVPPTFAAVLARAMSKEPERRFHSALALAHALQQVERALHLPVTSIDLAQDALPDIATSARESVLLPGAVSPTTSFSGPSEPGGLDDQATRLRPVQTIDPLGQQPAVPGPAVPGPAVAPPAAPAAQAPAAQAPAAPAPPQGPAAAQPLVQAQPVPMTAPDDDATRLRPVTSIAAQVGPSPQAVTAPGTAAPAGLPAGVSTAGLPSAVPDAGLAAGVPGTRPPAGPGAWDGGSAEVLSGLRPAPTTATAPFSPTPEEIRSQHYRRPSELADATARRRTRTRRVRTVVASAVVVAALGTVATLALRGGATPNPQETLDPDAPPTVVADASVPAPAQLVGVDQEDGTARFTWTNPDPREGDAYLWRELTVGSRGTAVRTTSTSVTVPLPDGATEVCVEVSVVRSNGQVSSTPAQECSS